MVREITLAGFKTNGTVMKQGGAETKWEAERDKNEELTSNRSAGQIIEGKTRKAPDYRLKSFNDNELSFSPDIAARRAAVRVVQQIKKELGQ